MPIAFKQVTYTYPCSQHPAVQDLTVTIPPGRRCALIGRNGCGKSTLLRLADGLFRPDRGQIYWQGQPLNYRAQALRSLRQQVGLVFQDPEQQLVATTVEEDLSYGLCNLGLPDAEVANRVQLALQEFDLRELADTSINHLSLGQKKRVAIADVMVLRPQLLLMDEPTAYLDPAQTRTLFQSLERIHAAGTTIVIATHDLEFVYAWADWLMVMDQGRIVLVGTAQEVFANRTVLHALGLGLPLVIDIMAELPGSKTDLGRMHEMLRKRFIS
ncbi:MAG: ABC transporter ATP-binding protein [Cyanobacteria bacterium J06639_14]